MSDEDQSKRSRIKNDKGNAPPAEENKLILPNYALVRFVDMDDSMKQDVIDTLTECSDRYITNPEAAAQAIKEKLDKNYGTNWHVVVGESFGFDVNYEPLNLIYALNGSLGILAFKCD